MSFPSIESVLAYQNDDVVHRFAEGHSVSVSDAQEIFTETKRWLWICAKRKVMVDNGEIDFMPFPLFNEANAIDLMWHTFLLYTQDYADFCNQYFGFFIHHQPRSRAERLEWQKTIQENPDYAREVRKETLRKSYEYLYDEIGPEILVKWCEEFPARFQSL